MDNQAVGSNKALSFVLSDSFVMSMVGLNALVLFLDAFPVIHEYFGHALFIVDYICILYFVFEAVVKLFVLQKGQYFRCGWNIFDFIVVLVSSPALLSPFGLLTHRLAGLLILRLARLFRFLKLLRFIPNVNRLFEGARRALRAGVGILLVSLFYIFTFGIAATYLFGMGENSVPEFQNPLISMYTMFKVFTVEGWFEMSDTIAGNENTVVAHFIRAFFVLAVVFGGIIILSLLNAVFVDEMSADVVERHQDDVQEIQSQISQLRTDIMNRFDELSSRIDKLEGK